MTPLKRTNSWEVNSAFCNRPRGRGYESVDTSHVQWSGGHVSPAEKWKFPCSTCGGSAGELWEAKSSTSGWISSYCLFLAFFSPSIGVETFKDWKNASRALELLLRPFNLNNHFGIVLDTERCNQRALVYLHTEGTYKGPATADPAGCCRTQPAPARWTTPGPAVFCNSPHHLWIGEKDECNHPHAPTLHNFDRGTTTNTEVRMHAALTDLYTCLNASTMTGAKSWVNSGPFLLLFWMTSLAR